MADPNQTPERGDWACPCNGCAKAVAYERKQLITLIENLGGHEEVITLIRDRIPKPKVRKQS